MTHRLRALIVDDTAMILQPLQELLAAMTAVNVAGHASYAAGPH